MREEIRNMKHSDIEVRKAEIAKELENEDITEEKVDELSEEVNELNEREEEIAEEVKAEAEERANVLKSANVIEQRKVESNMNVETRKQEMIEAVAEYIKGTATQEQRALLTTNAQDGTVNVAEVMDNWIWTDWTESPILSRIRKVYIKGNYKVEYEASATGAFVHEEGTEVGADKEEQLALGVIEFVAQYVKKFIKVSDEVLALRGQAFLDYLYREFGHQLAKAIEGLIITELTGSDLTAKVTHALDGDATLAGLAMLSDEATNPVVICSKSTYASIKGIRTQAGNRIEDAFEGLEVLFNNSVEGLLVGDLDGVVANFPDGDDFKFIVDNYSLAEQDLVKIVGKVMVSAHLVRPNGFAYVTAE